MSFVALPIITLQLSIWFKVFQTRKRELLYWPGVTSRGLSRLGGVGGVTSRGQYSIFVRKNFHLEYLTEFTRCWIWVVQQQTRVSTSSVNCRLKFSDFGFTKKQWGSQIFFSSMPFMCKVLSISLQSSTNIRWLTCDGQKWSWTLTDDRVALLKRRQSSTNIRVGFRGKKGSRNGEENQRIEYERSKFLRIKKVGKDGIES